MKLKPILMEILRESTEKLDFHNLSLSDILSDPEDLKSVKGSDHILRAYEYENGLESDEGDYTQEEYDEYAQGRIEEVFEELYANMYNYVEGDSIDIWREMTVPKEWVQTLGKDRLDLGIYWSYTKEGAEAHWGEGGDTVLVNIGTTVSLDQVDWKSTFIVKLQIDHADDEQEVRLFKGVPIKIKELSVDGEEVDVSELKKLTFKA